MATLAGETPVKKGKPSCMCCLDPSPARFHRIDSKKWRQEEVDVKLAYVIGDESTETVLKLAEGWLRLGICRVCLSQLNSAFTFMSAAHESFGKLNSENFDFGTKRLPKTPAEERAKEMDKFSKKRRSGKSLKFEAPSDPDLTESSTFLELSNSFLEDPTLPMLHDAMTSSLSPGLLSGSGSPVSQPGNKPLISSFISSTPISNRPMASAAAATLLQPDNRNLSSTPIISSSSTLGSHQPMPSAAAAECMTPESLMKQHGLQFNPVFLHSKNASLNERELSEIRAALAAGSVRDIARAVYSIPSLRYAVQFYILQAIDSVLSTLCKRTQPFSSVLRRHSKMSMNNEDNLLAEIVTEMHTRCPFVLDVFITMSTGFGVVPNLSWLGPITLAYSSLMSLRNEQLSALQRRLTLLAYHGGANDMLLTRLNKFKVTLSTSSKITLLDECMSQRHSQIVHNIKLNPWIKLVGDNLDMFLRVGQQTSERQHKDLHYFTSVIMFSRLPDELPAMDPNPRTLTYGEVQPRPVIELQPNWRDTLMAGYHVVLGRILANQLPALRWLERVLPKHMPHRFSDQMNQKSTIFCLPLLLCNEAKYDDCVRILDLYVQELSLLYTAAFGDDSKIRDGPRVPVGGDWLTHVRLEVAKEMRLLAPHVTENFGHLGPVVGEMWHNQRDLLEADFVRVAHPKRDFAGAAEEACMNVSALVERLNTNQSIHEALKQVVDQGDHMPTDAVDKRVAELFMFDFQQSGIHLEENQRQKFVHLNESIMALGTYFMQGTAKSISVPRDKLPANLGQWFTVNGDSVMVTGLFSDHFSDVVREAAYKLYLYPDPHQMGLLQALLEHRFELAQLVGFPTYGHRTLRGTLAQDPETVMSFLETLADKVRPHAEENFKDIQALKATHGIGGEVKPWDTAYYCGLARHQRCELSSGELAPYFSLGSCMEGLGHLFSALYGIALQHQKPEPGEMWHADVHKLAVVHETEGVLGHIYCDFFERFGKPHQDCHFTIRGGRQKQDGSYQLPVVVLLLNLPPKQGSTPSLLSPGMMENLFHEFGHAMHSMLGRTRYQHVTGTRCPTDFAEVPSVLMEYFATDPRVVSTFARHWETGEPLSENKIQDLCRAKRMFAASEMQQQVYYSILDQRYHGNHPLSGTTTDILEEVQNTYYSLPYIPGTAWQLRFGHFVGYGAKYYSYLMSRAVASRIWHQCFKQDPFNRTMGERYRHKVLAHGGGIPPLDLIEAMLNERPTTGHLVESLMDDILDE